MLELFLNEAIFINTRMRIHIASFVNYQNGSSKLEFYSYILRNKIHLRQVKKLLLHSISFYPKICKPPNPCSLTYTIKRKRSQFIKILQVRDTLLLKLFSFEDILWNSPAENYDFHFNKVNQWLSNLCKS